MRWVYILLWLLLMAHVVQAQGLREGGNIRPARDTIVIRDTVVVMMHRRDTVVMMMPATHRDTVVMMMPAKKLKVMTAADSLKARRKAERQARRDSLLEERLLYSSWAVKTNLLMWGVVAPNIQLEIPLGRNHWSLELEYFTPWFTWSHNAHASQFQNVGLELRYYPGNRERRRWLQGWHIGLAGAAGYYDWEWKKSEGYQGEYLNGYLNIGYQHRWGRHWGLDMGIGLGAMFTKYRHYYGGSVYPDNHLEEWDEHLIYHHSGHYLWPGPCHANLSLVYFFNKKRKKLIPYFATTY